MDEEVQSEATPAPEAAPEPVPKAALPEAAPPEAAPPEAAPKTAMQAALEAAGAQIAVSPAAAPKAAPQKTEGGRPPRQDRPPRPAGEPRPGGGGESREHRPGGERGGGPGGDRGGERGGPGGDRGRGGDRGYAREGPRPGGGRPFEGPADIELEKLIADSLYLDNQAHAVVARMRDMDSGTKSQLRRLYNAVRRAVRAPESERQHQFVMLRARLAYTIARHSLRSLDALERLLLQVTRRNDARGYERFKDLFEAIVAYNE